MSDWLLQNANYGDRYRFVNYQTAYVTKDGADPKLICSRLIPSVATYGTVIKLVIIPGCENCGLITDSLVDDKM